MGNRETANVKWLAIFDQFLLIHIILQLPN